MSAQRVYGSALAASLVVLGAGIGLQVGGVFAHSATASRLMTAFGKASSDIGIMALGISFPLYLKEKKKENPHTYKYIAFSAVTGLFAGTFLSALDLNHPIAPICGGYLTHLSGYALVTVCVNYVVNHQDDKDDPAADSRRQPAPRPVTVRTLTPKQRAERSQKAAEALAMGQATDYRRPLAKKRQPVPKRTRTAAEMSELDKRAKVAEARLRAEQLLQGGE